MGASVAKVTGGIASLLLSTLMLCFNGPRIVGAAHSAPSATEQARPTREDHVFHAMATLDVGKGKRLTLQLELGRPEKRSVKEAE